MIVKAIDEEKNCNLIYDYIYDNIVDYCVSQIKSGNYEETYQRYKDSVLSLENTFLRNKNQKVLKLSN